MSMHIADDNLRPAFDKEITDIADYALHFEKFSPLALDTARYCLMDTLGCALLALRYPACTKLLGPVVPGTIVPKGARVLGTDYVLDPIQAAFNNGTLVRWLDFNDTWLAAEWGHPSDNLGAILSLADYINRSEQKKLTIKDVLQTLIKAHEIQGVIALENAFNRVGLDHVILVKVASTAASCFLLNANMQQTQNALSLAWLDGQSLRTYRHAPNTGTRKSWAAGDATSRGLRLAYLAMRGEMGYPSVLTAKKWGFYDVSFGGQALKFSRSYENYVMENVLFKISYPAEFHAQTAVEAAIQLHPQLKNIDDIERIEIETQESAVRIISKEGALYNPADRDHCLQYMIAIGLLFGELTADHYEDNIAKDSRIDRLRSLMKVSENKQFTKDYLDPDKRSIANAIQIFFKDGKVSEKITIEYPVGHKRRREEGIPLLIEKFKTNVGSCFDTAKVDALVELFLDEKVLFETPVDRLMDALVR